MLATLVGGPLLSPPARGQGQSIALECRLGAGGWQPCRMEVVNTGHQWFLVVGQRRYGFHHDGSGRVRMSAGGRWQEVNPRWDNDGSLCWDGVCVRGEIPLD